MQKALLARDSLECPWLCCSSRRISDVVPGVSTPFEVIADAAIAGAIAVACLGLPAPVLVEPERADSRSVRDGATFIDEVLGMADDKPCLQRLARRRHLRLNCHFDSRHSRVYLARVVCPAWRSDCFQRGNSSPELLITSVGFEVAGRSALLMAPRPSRRASARSRGLCCQTCSPTS